MKKIITIFALMLLGALLPNSSYAQSPLPCRSFDGFQVPYIVNPQLNDVGRAYRDGYGNPIIEINPNVLAYYTPLTKQFWFAHECGHHALYPQQNSEPSADCFAVKNLRSLGMMTYEQDVDDMLWQISQLPGNYQTGHLPGPARAQNMYICLTQP